MTYSIEVLVLKQKLDISMELAETLFSMGSVKTIEKGNLVALEGAEPVSLIFPISGMFGAQPTLEEGQEHAFKVYGPGMIINDAYALQPSQRHCDIRCMQESRVLYISLSKVRRLLEVSIELNHLLLASVSKKLNASSLLLFIRKEKNPTLKVSRALNFLATVDENKTVHLNYSELGALINTSRNTIAEVIDELLAKKKVTKVNGTIKLSGCLLTEN
ncbi:Crp/Fnr family transcriptional regulator [Vibrio ishigakensis]|uniref:Crp/Fnr family transcriptional regulator n=1 Tax=Vibrio ishigakensis TaxID=1481914 RepID=UPI0021C4BA9E|nr:Crp/Fnr family transcriptional regulator [Vibrio ishigakensis]